MTKRVKKVEKKQSASQEVELFIKEAIYTGRLKPRERIIEDDIARQLGCSRGPVREAMLRLERDGLVVTTPRRGTFIRDITPAEVEEIFSIRGKLEALCVRYMRQDMKPEAEGALRQCLRELKQAATAGDDDKFFQGDMRLHHTIWSLSGRPQLYRTLNYLMNPFIFMVAREYSTSVNTVAEAYKNHEDYVEMILTTPLARVEAKVEQYYKVLYERIDKRVFRLNVFRPPVPGPVSEGR
jgi:DNA-binding GntR family transcriptional regulator